jgi:hypothetical protein
LRKSGRFWMAIDEQRLLHLVQYFVFQVVRASALEQLEAEGVNRADEHLGHAPDVTERLASPGNDPRSFSSAAALSVKVNAMMLRGWSASDWPGVSNCATRRATTSVLPEPAIEQMGPEAAARVRADNVQWLRENEISGIETNAIYAIGNKPT